MDLQTLAHYRIVRILGKGGMGEVYLAEDTRLKRPVALKILPPGPEAASLAQRFGREARAASSLAHPNIAHIYDVGEDGGIRYIAMEYVDGQPLNELVREGPLTESRILGVATQIADALDEAHAKGVVHRDIKPQNILMTPRGQVKVLDFGLAKLSNAGVTDDDSTDLRTGSGMVMGTVNFMSPEQALGRDTDHRTDVFSMGVVLYALAAGRLPFSGDSATATIDRIVHGEPEAIARFNYSISAELERIIRKCLEKDRERRYQTARELLVDLRNLQRDGSAVASVPPAPSQPGTGRRPSSAWWILVAAVAAGLLGWALLSLRSRPTAAGVATPARIDAIAVLPLTAQSSEPGQEYFVNGLTELLTTELAKLQSVKVMSQSSAKAYGDEKARNLAGIGRELNVQGIVQGTVAQAGERVRINAQLVQVPSSEVIWADTFERTRADLFGLQSEIARAIAARIEGRLTPQHEERFRTARPIAAEASQLYLKGRYEWAKRTPEGMKQALDHYQQALQVDPAFARAYAGIAEYYSVLPFYSSFAPRETFPKAKEAALKALELDPSLPEARASLGYIKTYYEWDWEGAEREFRKALELRPSNADLRHWYSRYLTTRGRHDEALAEIRLAQELDPLSKLLHANLAMVLYFARRYDDAIEQLQRTLELDPKFPVVYWGLGLSYVQKGMMKESVASLEKARELSPRSTNTLASLGHAYAAGGDPVKARAILEDLERQSKQKYISAYQFALLHTGLGETDEAMRWLERGFEERTTLLVYVNMDPRFDALRAEPRFRDLMRRINLQR